MKIVHPLKRNGYGNEIRNDLCYIASVVLGYIEGKLYDTIETKYDKKFQGLF